MSLYEFDSVQIEKERAVRRYNRLHQLSGIIKMLELVAAFTILSWSVSRWSSSSYSASAALVASVASYVSEAVCFCGEFLRRVSLLLLSPHFVFLIGNAIILTLLLHSSSSHSSETATSVTDQSNAVVVASEPEVVERDDMEKKEIVHDDEVSRRRLLFGKRRTRSAEFEVVHLQDEQQQKVEYRRSETELCRKAESLDGGVNREEEGRDEVEDLSSEEFQRRVEAFIARQQRFLREESLSAAGATNVMMGF